MAAGDHIPTVAVCCAEPARLTDAAALATRLSLPLIHAVDARFEFLLALTVDHLELRKCSAGAPGAMYADFVSGPFGYRRVHSAGRRQPLARAIGLKRTTGNLYVMDVTAGLGRDAFLLALLGCRVTMIERSPIVHALLADGLARAQRALAEHAGYPRRLTLTCADAIRILENLAEADLPDTVYLDPMYPHRDQSALNRKDMRMLRELVGADDDASELLAAALRRARRRVTVKRPRLARAIAGPAPTLRLNGKATRYDIYIMRASANPGNSRTATADRSSRRAACR